MAQDIQNWLAAAARALPYYGRAIAAMTPVEKQVSAAPGQPPTISVDKRWRLYWSPEALTLLADQGNDPVALIQHEVEHLLRQHNERCQERAPYVWNCCADAEINDDLTGLVSGVTPDKLPGKPPAGLTAEEYYDRLPPSRPPSRGVCGGGSGVDGIAREYEAGDGEATGVGQHEVERLLDAVASDVEAHASRGTVPAGVLVWAQARKKGRLMDWRILLRGAVRRTSAAVAGVYDYSYRRGHRHQPARVPGEKQILHPGHMRPSPDIDVIVDTSGSMGSHGDLVAGVLDSIRRSAQGKVSVISCDAAVHEKIPLKSWRTVQYLHGGGGTDLRVAFERVTAPIVVVLTDCETPWPESSPSARVVVVRYGSTAPVPGWAKLIDVSGATS